MHAPFHADLPKADIAALLQPRASSVPSKGELRAFVQNTDGICLPVLPDLYDEWAASDETRLYASKLQKVQSGLLAARLSMALRTKIRYKSEQDVCVWVQDLLVSVLEVRGSNLFALTLLKLCDRLSWVLVLNHSFYVMCVRSGFLTELA